MDFMVSLLGYDSICIFVDSLMKFVHFVLVKVKYIIEKLAQLYVSRFSGAWNFNFYYL